MASLARRVGQTVGVYMPDLSGSYPAYPIAGRREFGTIDPLGHVAKRPQVYSDKGGWTDDFSGAALGADWTTAIGATGSITVAGSLLTIAYPASPAASSLTYASRLVVPSEMVPLVAHVFVAATAPGAPTATVTPRIEFGFYALDAANPLLSPRHATATANCQQWRWIPSDALTTFRARASNDGTFLASAPIGVNRTLAGWRSVAAEQEQLLWRDGSTGAGVSVAAAGVPPPTLRAVLSRNQPDPQTRFFFSVLVETGGAPGAMPAMSIDIDAISIRAHNRLVANTGF
jgi:hypothetical protein